MKTMNVGHLMQSIDASIKMHKEQIKRLKKQKEITIYLMDKHGVAHGQTLTQDLDAVKDILKEYKLETFKHYNEWLMTHPARKTLISDKVSAKASKTYTFLQVDKLVREVLE